MDGCWRSDNNNDELSVTKILYKELFLKIFIGSNNFENRKIENVVIIFNDKNEKPQIYW